MLILGNPYPPPLVFLRGGMLILGNSLSTIRKFIHPPPGNLYPPPPVFLGGVYGYPIPGGGGMAVLEQ